ncbi:MAG TPA: hypothetical protein ENJ32_02150, partial [Crenotrichaceae bacterium]|nr:hypothetical protein [Crenotrichaceae bacterium]
MFILGVKHIFNRAFRQFISVLLTALLLQNACADGGQRSAPATESTPPKLALARIYQPVDDLTAYWVSEKLDGVRAYWNGKQLLSRSGRVYHAPAWFVRDFPTRTLDGELWISRGRFEQLVSTVRKHYPVDIEWKQVKYMVFDLPDSPAVFDIRLIELHQLLEKINNPFIELIKQFRVESHQALM